MRPTDKVNPARKADSKLEAVDESRHFDATVKMKRKAYRDMCTSYELTSIGG